MNLEEYGKTRAQRKALKNFGEWIVRAKTAAATVYEADSNSNMAIVVVKNPRVVVCIDWDGRKKAIFGNLDVMKIERYRDFALLLHKQMTLVK